MTEERDKNLDEVAGLVGEGLESKQSALAKTEPAMGVDAIRDRWQWAMGTGQYPAPFMAFIADIRALLNHLRDYHEEILDKQRQLQRAKDELQWTETARVEAIGHATRKQKRLDEYQRQVVFLQEQLDEKPPTIIVTTKQLEKIKKKDQSK